MRSIVMTNFSLYTYFGVISCTMKTQIYIWSNQKLDTVEYEELRFYPPNVYFFQHLVDDIFFLCLTIFFKVNVALCESL